MSQTLTSRALQAALDAALHAGETITQIRASSQLEVRYKGDRDLVTKADLAAEDVITSGIKRVFSDHAFLTEESSPGYRGTALTSGALWVIDPVDGTTNYARGHMHCAVSIAFALDGVVLAAVVHAPFMNETYTATKGGGVYLNGCPIHVAPTMSLKAALVATGFPYQRDSTDVLGRKVRNVLDHCQDIRRLGSASIDICWVAGGRLDAYYETVNPWDMAAAALIAREAGATVGHHAPTQNSGHLPPDLVGENLLITAPAIFEKLAALL